MTYLISCEFNMDTACVELKFNDGSMIAIDTIAVETRTAFQICSAAPFSCGNNTLPKS